MYIEIECIYALKNMSYTVICFAQAKRDAQDSLLLDEDDPTLNNPALDLEDSDVDDEWTPVKVS